MSPLVSVHDVAKRYPKVHRKRDRLVGLLATLRGRRALPSVEVLSDIDLTVARGESLALIGENGAGKSTLLKLIAGVLHPSAGTIEVNGSVAALLELGAGFHPDYTARRNLQLAGALLGWGWQRVHELIPEIAAFAELEDRLDEPIKHYSSGMVVRLGFALIAHTKPDLLISDEVLAVGDEAFQRKCIAWLEQYLAGGGTLLLVSHSLYHVQKLCHRACWIRDGRIHLAGDVFKVSQAYQGFHERKLLDHAGAGSAPARQTVLTDLRVDGCGAEQMLEVDGHAQLTVQVTAPRSSLARLSLARADGAVIASGRRRLEAGNNHVALPLPGLLAAQYMLQVTPIDATGQRCGNPLRRALKVAGQSRDFGSVALTHRWEQA